MSIVEDARRALGPVGVYLPVSFTSMPPMPEQRDAAVRLEQAGYPAIWVNEALGKDAFTQVAILLAATDNVVFGSGIVNIWVREPQTAHAAAATLAQAHPGRFVLGIGVGYPQQAAAIGREFGRPMATLRDYLGRMTEQAFLPAPDARYPRILGANGPKMTALGAEIADGALPAMCSPEFTAQARELLGPDKLLVVGMSIKGEFAPNSPDEVAVRAKEHHEAGADHVILMPDTDGGLDENVTELERLAPTVVTWRRSPVVPEAVQLGAVRLGAVRLGESMIRRPRCQRPRRSGRGIPTPVRVAPAGPRRAADRPV